MEKTSSTMLVFCIVFSAVFTLVSSVTADAQHAPKTLRAAMVKQGAGKTRTMKLINNCKQDIWWASGGNAKPGGYYASPGNGGDYLKAGASTTVTVNLEPQGPGSNTYDWSGRFWPRTGCSFNSAGIGLCETGGCADDLHCKVGVGGTPPASLVELYFGENMYDTYDLSYVDGTNVPIQIKPTNVIANPRRDKFGCGTSKCAFDFAKESGATDESSCLNALKYRNSKGVLVGCNSACQVFDAGNQQRMQNSQYCCTGRYSGPPTRQNYGNCPPTQYAQFFLQKCSDPYPWPQGDKDATYSCVSTAYEIIFCPAP